MPAESLFSNTHPSVTDPVESLSSPGFWKKSHWVGQFATGSAYFRLGFCTGLFNKKMASYRNEGFSITFPLSAFRKWLSYNGHTEGRKEKCRKHGRSQDFFQRYTQFLKCLSTAPPPLHLEAIASYFLHHQPDGYVVCFRLNRRP